MKHHLLLLLCVTFAFAIRVADGAASSSSGETWADQVRADFAGDIVAAAPPASLLTHHSDGGLDELAADPAIAALTPSATFDTKSPKVVVLSPATGKSPESSLSDGVHDEAVGAALTPSAAVDTKSPKVVALSPAPGKSPESSLLPSARRFLSSNSSSFNDTSSYNDTSSSNETSSYNDTSPFNETSSFNDTSSSNETSPFIDTSSSKETSSSTSNDDTYDRIMAMQNRTFLHRCYVVVIDRGPLVWCDINVPVNLNVTAEIRDGTCDEFNTTASSDFFTMGIAQPIFVPDVTEEEKRMGTFDHSYCAGVDILYNEVNVTTGDAQQVSLLSGRFAMEITYSYEERVNDESGEIEEELSSAILSDENTKSEEENKDLGIGLGVLAGAVVTLALVAIIYGKKRPSRRRRQQQDDDGIVDVEIAPMVAPVTEENEII